jgi:MYXO-CTERM domain-containing protein
MLDVPLPRPPAPDAGTDDAGALNDGGAIVFADGGVVSEGGIIQVPVPITDGGPVARMRPDSGTREADASNEEGDAGSAGGAPGSTGGCSVSAGFQAEDPTSVALFFLTGFVTAARRRRARAIA